MPRVKGTRDALAQGVLGGGDLHPALHPFPVHCPGLSPAREQLCSPQFGFPCTLIPCGLWQAEAGGIPAQPEHIVVADAHGPLGAWPCLCARGSWSGAELAEIHGPGMTAAVHKGEEKLLGGLPGESCRNLVFLFAVQSTGLTLTRFQNTSAQQKAL